MSSLKVLFVQQVATFPDGLFSNDPQVNSDCIIVFDQKVDFF